MTDLRHLAVAGTEIAVRVTPKAGRNAVVVEPERLRVYVTAAPEAGRANAAVRKLLAEALGIAPSRLRLVRGLAGRDKRFRVEE